MHHVTLESLPPLARQLAEEALAWLEPHHDDARQLLRYPGRVEHYGPLKPGDEPPHLVRESVWWAIGLLLRNQGDDATRAAKVLEAVLAWQFTDRESLQFGTFHRAPQEPLPPARGAKMWDEYDPNWRQFIGTSFLIILERLADLVSPELQARLKESIRLAVEGETPERIEARYSNIAMMQAVQLVYAGGLFQRPDWKKRGLSLAREIYELFAEHETFAEYNSPTYYGVNLYALRLWQFELGCPELQDWGAKMEVALWRHVARYYHPGLRNICGPYDRSYGMDMTRYCSGIGVWMRLELEPEIAPSPALESDFHHRHDYALAPVVALLGVNIPAELREPLRTFQVGRLIRDVIEDKPAVRVATACLLADRMWGAEAGPGGGGYQYHAVTAHWLQPGGAVGWLRSESHAAIDAVADKDGIRMTITGREKPLPLVWHFFADDRKLEIHAGEWRLPGVTIRVKTSLAEPKFSEDKEKVQSLTYVVPAAQKATFELEFLPGKP